MSKKILNNLLIVLILTLSVFGLAFPLGAQVYSLGAQGASQLNIPLDAQVASHGNIKIGPVAVHPFMGAAAAYSDNIYRNYGNFKSESDSMTTLSPGIQFVLPLQRHSLQLDYVANINWFASNSNTNYTTQNVGGAVKFDFPGGLLLNLSDYYSDDKIPRKAKNGNNSASDPFRELPFNANDFKASTKYRFLDRWAVEGRYYNYDYKYQNNYDDGGSYNRGTFGGAIYYRLTPKIDALLDYSYNTMSYKTSSINDNKGQGGYIGLSFDPTAKLRGYLKVGLITSNYDNDLGGRRSTSFSTFGSLVDLTYTLSRYDDLTLRANRQIYQDLDTNAPYTFTDISLWYKHILAWNPKISLKANAGYGTLKFEQGTTDADGSFKTRDDKRYYGGVGVGYALQRWLNLGLNYTYTNNDSNFLNYNYKENRVWLSAIAAF